MPNFEMIPVQNQPLDFTHAVRYLQLAEVSQTDFELRLWVRARQINIVSKVGVPRTSGYYSIFPSRLDHISEKQ